MIEMGADTNAQDGEGNTPLCMTVQQHPVNWDLVGMMLNYGAHMDVSNRDRLSPFKFLKKNPIVYTAENFPLLKCLAAQALRQANLPYEGIGKRLTKFVDQH